MADIESKANCKNNISGQVLNRWNEVGGIKFSSSQPLQVLLSKIRGSPN